MIYSSRRDGQKNSPIIINRNKKAVSPTPTATRKVVKGGCCFKFKSK